MAFIVLSLTFLFAFQLLSYLAEFKTTKKQSFSDILFLTVFAILLLLPAAKIDVKTNVSQQEKRELSKYKSFITGREINFNYGRDFEEWFNDRFFGRRLLVNNYTRLKNKINGRISSSSVFEGDEKWLFVNSIISKIYTPLEQNEFPKYKTALAKLKQYADDNNIKLYVQIVPDREDLFRDKLSTWFKLYLYIPLGGNRVPKWRMYLNLGIVFLATGIWHGASWNFVFWGIWHGLFIIIEKMTNLHKESGNKLRNAALHFYTLFVLIVGWVMFRSETMSYAWAYLKNMFFMAKTGGASFPLTNVELLAFAAAAICSVPVFSKMLSVSPKQKVRYALINVWLIVLFILSAMTVAASTYNPFIYFRF